MSFLRDVKKFVDNVELRAKSTVATAASRMATDIIKMTPVDQPTGPNGEFPVWHDPSNVGEARAGWRASINTPAFAINGALDQDGSITISQASREFYQYNAKRDHTLYLSNGVPYVGILENGGYAGYIQTPIKSTESGFSYQAPAGMMKIHTSRWSFYVRDSIGGGGGGIMS
jgi:hypothetical protein